MKIEKRKEKMQRTGFDFFGDDFIASVLFLSFAAAAESAKRFQIKSKFDQNTRLLPLRNSINFSRSVICVRIWVIKFSFSLTGFVN
jgi:hypothetical protein